MPTPPEDLTPEERLRIENELTKARLEQDHGAVFGAFSEEGLPPELEAQFLASVEAFEKASEAPLVPIRNFVSPELLSIARRKAEAGDFEGASEWLAKEITRQAGVTLDRPGWLSEEGYYRYLSTDLLDFEIPEPTDQSDARDIKRVLHVAYDDVRSDSPNHMATVTEAFLADLLHYGHPFSGHLLAHTCRDGADVVDKATATQKIRRWKEQWTEIIPIGFGPAKPLRGPDGAIYFQFGCAYHVTDKKGNREEYEGPGLSQLALEDGEFRVVGFVMEGFEM